jgi:hypothetical protein
MVGFTICVLNMILLGRVYRDVWDTQHTQLWDTQDKQIWDTQDTQHAWGR